jgi:hypothetical protein
MIAARSFDSSQAQTCLQNQFRINSDSVHLTAFSITRNLQRYMTESFEKQIGIHAEGGGLI